MIRLGGAAPPQVDPAEETRNANQAVIGNFLIFGFCIGLIRLSPTILEQFGL
jgi:hypothetical protein